MPDELKDPAVACASEITCVRALVFGRLAHDGPRFTDKAQVFIRDGRQASVGNLRLFQPRERLDSRRTASIPSKAF